MPRLHVGSFAEFWPFYVREHRRPATRTLHFLGLLLAFGAIVAAAVAQRWLGLIAAPLLGYGFAWIGHVFVEHNRPASFDHPVWSVLGDFKMFVLMLIGRMEAEVSRCIGEPSHPPTLPRPVSPRRAA